MLNDFTQKEKYKNIIDEFDHTLFDLIKVKISHLMSFKKEETDEEIRIKASILQATEISQPAILLLSIVILNLKTVKFIRFNQK